MSFVVGTEGLRQFDVRFAVCAGSIAARICFLVFPSGMVEALRLEVKKRIAKPARSTYCGLLRPFRAFPKGFLTQGSGRCAASTLG
jgi:hypothetical protein